MLGVDHLPIDSKESFGVGHRKEGSKMLFETSLREAANSGGTTSDIVAADPFVNVTFIRILEYTLDLVTDTSVWN